MKKRQIAGGLAISLGIIWIMAITFVALTNFLPVQMKDVIAWAEQVYFPASAVSTIFYIGFLLSWIWYSFNRRCKNSAEVKKTIGNWLLLMGLAILSNITILLIFSNLITVQSSSTQISNNIPPYEFLIPFAFVNGLLLFWLPSCFLSQRSLRFVPPLSYELNSFIEKR